MYVKFNDCDITYDITRISYYDGVVVLKGSNIPFNASGFIFNGDDGIRIDYSEFKYKFNILTEMDGILMLSSNKDIFEDENHKISDYYVDLTDKQIDDLLRVQKNNLIAASKESLEEYLKNNPIKSSAHNGVEGTYSITQEKQQLMTSQYVTYQIKKQAGLDAKLTWNETGKECEEWTEAEFLQLVMEIETYVHQLVSYQQSLETQIMNCATQEELDNIVIDYSSVVSK